MRSEMTRSITPRSLAMTMLLLASGLACSASAAGPKADASQTKAASSMRTIDGTLLKGRPVQRIQIQDPQRVASFGTVVDARGIEAKYLFRNEVVVQSTDWDLVALRIAGIPGAELGRELGSQGHFRVVETPSVGAAFEVQNALRDTVGVMSAEIESGIIQDRTALMGSNALGNELMQKRIAAMHAVRNQRGMSDVRDYVGVRPVETDSNPLSIPSAQWHFTNDGSASPFGQDWTGHDNNLLESIYSTDLITGAGVVVGISTLLDQQHVDTDHTELVNAGGRTGGYRMDLTQEFDPADDDDTVLTSYAGLIAAERNNPATLNDLQGVSPGAGLATFSRGPLPQQEYLGYRWKIGEIDIKVHDLFLEYETPQSQYNERFNNEFVNDAFKNSILFGRGRKGLINIFGTGAGFDFLFGSPTNLLADPYNFGPEPWDIFTGLTNEVAVSVTNGFLTGFPFYVGGQTHQFPLANNRATLLINTVSEDGNIDSLGAVGPGVFASVYAGSSNQGWSGSQAVSGRGVSTIVAGTQPPGTVMGEGPTGLMPATGADLLRANTTGASVAGGIVALMLEANPNLKVRDIQHIFFQSIQESMKPAAVKWPNYDSARFYYSPGAGVSGFASFWQRNSGLYSNPTPPVTVPPTSPVVNQGIRHSDQYGFGVIDANLAIQKAKTWRRLPQLVLLDSGLRGDVNTGEEAEEDPRLPVPIPDATFATPSVEADISGIDGAVDMIPGDFGSAIGFCVRQNLKIEHIVIELTIEGAGSNDLFISLTSPTGSRSILALPTTRNYTGQTDMENPADDELDVGFSSGTLGTTTYAYFQHPFLTYKHWGEFSGGNWTISFRDYGPDTENPEGVEPGEDPMAMPPEPGGDMIINLGEIGIPGSTIRTEKTVTAFRVLIYGTETGLEPFFGCAPGATACPGDLNADGIVNNADFILFLNWYQTGDARADLTSDGSVDILDVLFYRGIFVPGRCTPNGSGVINGRPRPSTTDISDNNPVTHPI